MSVVPSVRTRRGWLLFPIHYSMDASKDAAWRSEQRQAYLRQEDWNREMELDITEVGGVRAYPSFRLNLHVRESVPYNPMLPLCLACDFNVGIMVWPVVQIIRGIPHVIDEITMNPASVREMVRLFRNAYPAHPGELWVYGDAAGRARSAQDQQSEYDVLKDSLRGYPSPVVWKVPQVNSPVKERLNTVEAHLRNTDGEPRLFVSERCTELIKDLLEVLREPKGEGIKKAYDARDPYSARTHASDALGYMLVMEWPSVETTYRTEATAKRPRKKYGRLPGAL